MRKSDKKTEKRLIGALKACCSTALEQVEGFLWLTHFANYDSFPASLSIVCVFDTNDNRSRMYASNKQAYIYSLIDANLQAVGIKLKDIAARVSFDTEEDCLRQDGGSWKKRLQ